MWGKMVLRGGKWRACPITSIMSIYIISNIYYLINSICFGRLSLEYALKGFKWPLETCLWAGVD